MSFEIMKKSEFPIVLKVWAGEHSYDFDYIFKSIPSLLKSNLPPGASILIFNDCSTDSRLSPFLKELTIADPRVKVFDNPINKGPNLGQEYAYSIVEEIFPNAPFYINIDDDVIYHHDWLSKLLLAKKEANSFSLDGIFSAINMPYRIPHAKVTTQNFSLLLKWKQPALNWLIPKHIYSKIGPFTNEGIAYDTVYSHRLRLENFSVICLDPSYVQNIGIFGAYSKDKTTAARDYVGTDDIYPYLSRIIDNMIDFSKSQYYRFKKSYSSKSIFPIRWGSEWVYEAILPDGTKSFAFCLLDEQIRFGYSAEKIVLKANEVMKFQNKSPVSLRSIRKNRYGNAISLEYNWSFMPNLREYKKLFLFNKCISPRYLMKCLAEELLPFHNALIVHNKIRIENVYWDLETKKFHLAWFGTEPPSSDKIFGNRDQIISFCGHALDKEAPNQIKEMFSVRYIEAIAPEILSGHEALLSSDIYSIAAVVVCFFDGEISSLENLFSRKKRWGAGNFSVDKFDGFDNAFINILNKCLSTDPFKRYQNVQGLLIDLNN